MISENYKMRSMSRLTAEMWSSNLYLSMSFYFACEGFDGFAHWMKNNLRKNWSMPIPWLITLQSGEEKPK